MSRRSQVDEEDDFDFEDDDHTCGHFLMSDDCPFGCFNREYTAFDEDEDEDE